MADPFAVEPPRWLQELAKPPKGIGDTIGLALGGALNALKRDPNAPKDAPWLKSRMGLQQGFAEGRMNLADPLWRAKAAQQEAEIAGIKAKTAATISNYEQSKKEFEAQERDAPKYAAWMAGGAKGNPPYLESQQWSQSAQKQMQMRETSELNKTYRQGILESRKIQLQNQANALTLRGSMSGTTRSFLETWARMSDDDKWRVYEQYPNFQPMDQQGMVTTELMSAVQAWRADHGEEPISSAPQDRITPTRQSNLESLWDAYEKAVMDGDEEKASSFYQAIQKSAKGTPGAQEKLVNAYLSAVAEGAPQEVIDFYKNSMSKQSTTQTRQGKPNWWSDPNAKAEFERIKGANKIIGEEEKQLSVYKGDKENSSFSRSIAKQKAIIEESRKVIAAIEAKWIADQQKQSSDSSPGAAPVNASNAYEDFEKNFKSKSTSPEK